MKKTRSKKFERGFSLIELIVAMAITMMILGIAVTIFSRVLGTRARETSRTEISRWCGMTTTRARRQASSTG
jgi:Tfp pilus assembly protein PilW